MITANPARQVSNLWNLDAFLFERPALRVRLADGIMPLDGWEKIAWKNPEGPIYLWQPNRPEIELERSETEYLRNLRTASVKPQTTSSSMAHPARSGIWLLGNSFSA